VPTSRLALAGIHAIGRHGANPGEQVQAQEFVVDLDLSAVYGLEGVLRVVAVVHKPAAAASLGIDDVSAEAIIA